MKEQEIEESKDFGQILAEFEEKGGEEQGGDAAPVEAARGENAAAEIGTKVKGNILSIGETSAFVDLGGKSEAMIDVAQLRDPAGNLTVAVGDEIEATVTGTDPETGSLVLRRKAGRGQDVALELRQALDSGIPVEGLVTAINKGGAEVQLSGMRAFCPLSQLDLRYVESPQQFIGQRLSFKVSRIEAGRTRPNIVLSRRVLLEEEAEARALETRDKLQVGAVLKGLVTSLTSYGAFVDLGGLEGMLHVSEIGHSRLAHPNEVLQVGQEVEVQLIKIEKGKDDKRPRISLSRKSLERDPWRDVADRFAEGTEVAGRVMRLESFGAFVEIAPGIEGLVHISEMGTGRRLSHSREAVQLGQDVRVRVLGVDSVKRRISLTMATRGVDDGRDEAMAGSYSGRGGASSSSSSSSAAQPSQAPAGGFGSMADFFKNMKRK